MTHEWSPLSDSFFVVVGFGIVAAVDHCLNLVGGPARFHVLMTRKNINCVKNTRFYIQQFSTRFSVVTNQMATNGISGTYLSVQVKNRFPVL